MNYVAQIFRELAGYLGRLDLSAFFQGAGAIWVAVVATIALRTWRKQLHAEKQLTFIDELTDTVHEFILLMSAPVTQLELAQIGIEAYKGAASGFERYENAHAIAYISKVGNTTSSKLFGSLAEVKPVLGKMRALAVKGQVLGFSEYSRCQNSCQLLGWTHDHVEAFAAILGIGDINWENPTVQQSLNDLPKFDPARVRTTLQEQNADFIEFARQAYAKATGQTNVKTSSA